MKSATHQRGDNPALAQLTAFLSTDGPLPPRLRSILAKEVNEPEGRVRCEWVYRLVHEYGFSADQLALNVAAGAGRAAERSTVFADLVAYRDSRRKEPFLVVETKRPEERSGLAQVESYARNLGADYHIWTNGDAVRFFRTARYIDQSTPVGNVPRWLGGEPVARKPRKTLELPPFRDEEHLRGIVKLCHDRIFYRLGHDPAKAFDELMKVLFLKLYDERETPNSYDCVTLSGESTRDTAERVRELFRQAVKSRRYRDVFTTRLPSTQTDIDLDDDTIAFIVRHFQGYSLINTSATLEGADVKGTVFEKMVGGTFRGELGAYFTPREIVSFMVQLISPTSRDVVLDPACGSGGFLIMTLKYVLDDLRDGNPNLDAAEVYASLRAFAERNVFGADINERMARVTKMNMIMHGDGHGGIYHAHGLDIGFAGGPPLRRGDVTCVFSNPPFAGREEDTAQLSKFHTTTNEDGLPVETHKVIPFVEHILSLLGEDGRAALVLPNGVFNSQSTPFRKLRQIIWAKSELLAIVGLPHWVFFHTGCDVQGALLFLRRTDKPRADYPVHIDWADHVGYDSAGRKTGTNDLPEILERYQDGIEEHRFSARDLQARGRMDPLYYQPGDHQRVSNLEGAVPLTDLVVESQEVIKKRKSNNTPVRYVQVGDTDPASGAIVSWRDYPVCELPQRAKYIARENMLLLPNHRNSINAGRSVVLVPPEHDGTVVTSRFIVLRPKVPAVYLYHVLNLPIVKERMLGLVSGSSSTELKFSELSEVRVPLPEGGDFDLFLERVATHRKRIDTLSQELRDEETALSAMFEAMYAIDRQVAAQDGFL